MFRCNYENVMCLGCFVTACFRLNALMKLDTIIENQKEQNALLRRVITKTVVATQMDEDVLPERITTLAEMVRFCTRLQDKESGRELRKKVIVKCQRWIRACGRPHKHLNVGVVNKDTYLC